MKLIALGLTALAGTVAAGVIATQTPTLADRGEEVVLRDDETPSVTQVDDDDDDDDDTNDRDETRDVASRVTLKPGVSRDDRSRAVARADVDQVDATRDSVATRQSVVTRHSVPTRQSVATREPSPAPAPDVTNDQTADADTGVDDTDD